MIYFLNALIYLFCVFSKYEQRLQQNAECTDGTVSSARKIEFMSLVKSTQMRFITAVVGVVWLLQDAVYVSVPYSATAITLVEFNIFAIHRVGH